MFTKRTQGILREPDFIAKIPIENEVDRELKRERWFNNDRKLFAKNSKLYEKWWGIISKLKKDFLVKIRCNGEFNIIEGYKFLK